MPSAMLKDTPAKPSMCLPDQELHLLLDRRQLAEAENITYRPAPCVKHPENPLTLDGQRIWQPDNLAGMIRWFPDEKLFRTNMVGGASSHDGIEWRRCAEGHRVNFLTGDPDPDPARRYKTVIHIESRSLPSLDPEKVKYCHEIGVPPVPGIGVGWSADALKWKYVHPILPARRDFHLYGTDIWGGGDGYNHAIWAPNLQKYVCFVRTNIDRGAYGGRKERAVGRMESDDFIHWTPHQICLRPWTDLNLKLGHPKADFYHLPVFRCGGVYLSILSVFHWQPDIVRVELAWSPDTIHWERVRPWDDFVPQGEEGAIDGGCNFAVQEPILVGDEMRWYYGASAGHHNRDSDRASGLCLATFRRDRFTGLEPEDRSAAARVTLKAVDIAGNELLLNADASRGEIRVELQDESSRPIEGFDFKNSIPIRTDATRVAAGWKSGRLATLRGQKLQIKFEINKASLYAFTFNNGDRT